MKKDNTSTTTGSAPESIIPVTPDVVETVTPEVVVPEVVTPESITPEVVTPEVVVTSDIEVPVIESTDGKVLTFDGKKVSTDGFRTVPATGERTRHISLEDGSSYDLTEEEYLEGVKYTNI